MKTEHIMAKADKAMTSFTAKIIALVWRLAVLILVALGYFEGKSFKDRLVSENPDVIENKVAIRAAQEAVQEAKVSAKEANGKADQLLATQTRVFDALGQVHKDLQTLNTSNATLTERVAGLGKTLDRVEAKQDAMK